MKNANTLSFLTALLFSSVALSDTPEVQHALTAGRLTKRAHAVAICRFIGIEQGENHFQVSQWEIENVLHGNILPDLIHNKIVHLMVGSRMPRMVPGEKAVIYLFPVYKRNFNELILQSHWDYSFQDAPVEMNTYFLSAQLENMVLLPEDEGEKNEILERISTYWRIIRSEDRNLQEYIRYLESITIVSDDDVLDDRKIDLNDAKSAERLLNQGVRFEDLRRRMEMLHENK